MRVAIISLSVVRTSVWAHHCMRLFLSEQANKFWIIYTSRVEKIAYARNENQHSTYTRVLLIGIYYSPLKKSAHECARAQPNMKRGDKKWRIPTTPYHHFTHPGLAYTMRYIGRYIRGLILTPSRVWSYCFRLFIHSIYSNTITEFESQIEREREGEREREWTGR